MTAKRARLVKARKYWRKRNVLWHRANDLLRQRTVTLKQIREDVESTPPFNVFEAVRSMPLDRRLSLAEQDDLAEKKDRGGV